MTPLVALEDRRYSLLEEATGDARRLGHWLTMWSATAEGIYTACCGNCGERVTVAPNSRGKAQIRGAAVMMYCRPLRETVT